MATGSSTLIGVCECGEETCSKSVAVGEDDDGSFNISILDLKTGDVEAFVTMSRATFVSFLYGAETLVNGDPQPIPVVSKTHIIQ